MLFFQIVTYALWALCYAYSLGNVSVKKGGFLSKIAEKGAYLERARRPKAKTSELGFLLIYGKYFSFILFRRLFAARWRVYHQSLDPINTPRIPIPAEA